MSIRLMTQVWDLDLPPGEKLVLLALADQANDEGRQCWPAVLTIAKKSGQGERTVRRALADLEAKGHLTRDHRDGTSTQYHVHPCQNGSPAKSAALPKTTKTPANLAPKTPRTTKPSEAKASKGKRFALPTDIPQEPWAGFEEMRRRIGKPMTDRARELAIDRLRKLSDNGWPPADVLNHCTLNSYQGIFPPKDDNHAKRPANDRQNELLNPMVRAAAAREARYAG